MYVYFHAHINVYIQSWRERHAGISQEDSFYFAYAFSGICVQSSLPEFDQSWDSRGCGVDDSPLHAARRSPSQAIVSRHKTLLIDRPELCFVIAWRPEKHFACQGASAESSEKTICMTSPDRHVSRMRWPGQPALGLVFKLAIRTCALSRLRRAGSF